VRVREKVYIDKALLTGQKMRWCYSEMLKWCTAWSMNRYEYALMRSNRNKKIPQKYGIKKQAEKNKRVSAKTVVYA
jgi:hypothetical protein